MSGHLLPEEQLEETLDKLKTWCETFQAKQRALDSELSKVSRDLELIRQVLTPDSTTGRAAAPQPHQNWIISTFKVCFDLCKFYKNDQKLIDLTLTLVSTLVITWLAVVVVVKIAVKTGRHFVNSSFFYYYHRSSLNWDKYYDKILDAARQRESIFKNCPLNIEGAAQRFQPSHFIDWAKVICTESHEAHMATTTTTHNRWRVVGAGSGIVDTSMLSSVPIGQRDQAILACLEFAYSVYDLKYIPAAMINNEGNIIAAYTLRNIVENSSGNDFDFSFTYGQRVTDEILELVKELCDGSYTALKSSTHFDPSEHDLETLHFHKSRTLDHLHTVAALVDSLERKVELTTCEQDEFIPASFKKSEPPMHNNLPVVAVWERRLDKAVKRLELLRDNAECAYLALLAGAFDNWRTFLTMKMLSYSEICRQFCAERA